MTKVMLNGKEIELVDELEPGEKELDTLDGFPINDENLSDTMEVKLPLELDDTIEIEKRKLEDTMEFDFGGDINE